MLSKKQRKEIKEKIKELENSLTRLKTKLDEDNKERQHEAIDHLEDYLKEIDGHFHKLNNFAHLVIKQIKELIIKK